MERLEQAALLWGMDTCEAEWLQVPLQFSLFGERAFAGDF